MFKDLSVPRQSLLGVVEDVEADREDRVHGDVRVRESVVNDRKGMVVVMLAVGRMRVRNRECLRADILARDEADSVSHR